MILAHFNGHVFMVNFHVIMKEKFPRRRWCIISKHLIFRVVVNMLDESIEAICILRYQKLSELLFRSRNFFFWKKRFNQKVCVWIKRLEVKSFFDWLFKKKTVFACNLKLTGISEWLYHQEILSQTTFTYLPHIAYSIIYFFIFWDSYIMINSYFHLLLNQSLLTLTILTWGMFTTHILAYTGCK